MAALLRYPSPHSLSLTYSDTHTGTRALGFLAIPTNPVLPECKAPPGVGQKPAHPGMGEPHWKSRLGVSLSTVTWGVGWGALLTYQYCLLQGNNPQPSQSHRARRSRPGCRGGGGSVTGWMRREHFLDGPGTAPGHTHPLQRTKPRPASSVVFNTPRLGTFTILVRNKTNPNILSPPPHWLAQPAQRHQTPAYLITWQREAAHFPHPTVPPARAVGLPAGSGSHPKGQKL